MTAKALRLTQSTLSSTNTFPCIKFIHSHSLQTEEKVDNDDDDDDFSDFNIDDEDDDGVEEEPEVHLYSPLCMCKIINSIINQAPSKKPSCKTAKRSSDSEILQNVPKKAKKAHAKDNRKSEKASKTEKNAKGGKPWKWGPTIDKSLILTSGAKRGGGGTIKVNLNKINKEAQKKALKKLAVQHSSSTNAHRL